MDPTAGSRTRALSLNKNVKKFLRMFSAWLYPSGIRDMIFFKMTKRTFRKTTLKLPRPLAEPF